MKRVPRKKTPAQQLRHLQHRVNELEELVGRLNMTAADLVAAVASLTDTVANLPAPQPQLVDQPTLDKAVADVQAADAALKAKTTT